MTILYLGKATNDFWPTNEEIGEMWFDDLEEKSKEKEDPYIPPHS